MYYYVKFMLTRSNQAYVLNYRTSGKGIGFIRSVTPKIFTYDICTLKLLQPHSYVDFLDI